MKWISHLAIGGATCAVVSPPLVPVAMLGSTAPDWMEWVARIVGRPVKHRGPTHYLTVWIGALIAFVAVWDWHGIGAAFAWGGLSHVLCDSLTVTGVPAAPWSDRRFHLLGGRLRTGEPGEYLTVGAVVIVCWAIAGQMRYDGYVPFFPDWAGRYEAGLATAKEWRDNRFRFF